MSKTPRESWKRVKRIGSGIGAADDWKGNDGGAVETRGTREKAGLEIGDCRSHAERKKTESHALESQAAVLAAILESCPVVEVGWHIYLLGLSDLAGTCKSGEFNEVLLLSAEQQRYTTIMMIWAYTEMATELPEQFTVQRANTRS